jgi:hypothetical protein
MFGPGYQAAGFPISAGKTHGPAARTRGFDLTGENDAVSGGSTWVFNPQQGRGGTVVGRRLWKNEMAVCRSLECVSAEENALHHTEPQGPHFLLVLGSIRGGQGWLGLSSLRASLSRRWPAPAKMRDEHVAPLARPRRRPGNPDYDRELRAWPCATLRAKMCLSPFVAALQSRQTANFLTAPETPCLCPPVPDCCNNNSSAG